MVPVSVFMIIKVIMGTANASKSIAAFLGMTQSEVASLKANEFDSAMRMLRAAANSDIERESLLRSARDHFFRSIGFEKNLRLVYAHIGLAMCHRQLGDNKNAIESLRDVISVDNYGDMDMFKAAARDGISRATLPYKLSQSIDKNKNKIQINSMSNAANSAKMIFSDAYKDANKQQDELIASIERIDKIKRGVEGYLKKQLPH